MDNFVTTVWNFVKNPQILYHADGYYIFRFSSIEDRKKVMQAGPCTYHNKTLILKHWVMDFVFDTEYITTIPLWVNLPGMPVRCWIVEALSKVASVIGRPFHTDRYTVEMNRISMLKY